MDFPEFWVKEHVSVTDPGEGTKHIACWGWSNLSFEEARQLAKQRGERAVDFFRREHRAPQRYAYGTRPLREQVLRRIENQDKQILAVITRNQYGCLVLNTARVLFVDVDLPDLEKTPGLLARVFGKKSPPEEQVSTTVAKIESWTQRKQGWSWRIYRTRAGLRLLATHALFEPEQVDSIFEELGADPLYRKLCSNQKSFRARLTPKPWRMHLPTPPASWPWQDEGSEFSFKKWEEAYLRASPGYATCHLLKVVGSNRVHPEIGPLVEIHDQVTQAQSSLRLA